MNAKDERKNLSIVLKEVDRLSKEPDLKLTIDEAKDYKEIRILGEILTEMHSPELTYYTGT
jgi:hypothetical protein